MARARNKATEAKATDTEAAELAAIEAALNGDGDAEVTIDDSKFEEVDDKELEAAIAADEAKKAAYEEQTSEIEVADAEEIEDAGKQAKKGGSKAKGSVSSKSANMEDFQNSVLSILGEGAAFDTEDGELTDDQVKDMMATITQKKVREKVVNMLQSVMTGSSLSTYSKIAVDLMVKAHLDGDKPVTLTEIKRAYEEKGYKSGTVNAQAGQMMSLFPALKMASRTERGVLAPNPNSVLLDAFASA